MQTIELEKATIHVVKVFDLKAGRKRGTLKDAHGTLWSPWAKDMATYVEGRDYEVEFEINNNGGVDYRNIERGHVLQSRSEPRPRALSAAATGEPQNGNGDYWRPKPRDPAEQKQIFVCAMLGREIDMGRGFMSEDQLVNRALVHSKVWERVFGAGAQTTAD